MGNYKIRSEKNCRNAVSTGTFKMRFLDGVIHKAANKKYKFEFIGDSITSGEGLFGAKSENDWVPMFMGAFNNYVVKTSDKLNAEFRVISQSGWGIVSSWDNNPKNTLPGHYKQVCAMMQGENADALGASAINDFNSWQPDAVIINLGSNDHSALKSPAWKDEESGKIFKQEADKSGNPTEDTVKNLKTAIDSFLTEIRLCNPNTYII